MGDAVNSKQKILDVAEKIFAEKGFDGARVSEIAGEAGVNKALIYYYFNSKEDILESLFSTLINDIMDFSINILKKGIRGLDNITEVDMDNFINIILDYMLSKKDILRVAMTESMKTISKQSIIIKIGEKLMSAEIEEMMRIMQKKGVDFSTNMKEQLVFEFFTGTLPILNYVLFKDEIIHNFNMNEGEYREYFIKALKQTHIAYHMNNHLNK
mgnify:CR=1 FL=1